MEPAGLWTELWTGSFMLFPYGSERPIFGLAAFPSKKPLQTKRKKRFRSGNQPRELPGQQGSSRSWNFPVNRGSNSRSMEELPC